jgi:hypothetical protein
MFMAKGDVAVPAGLIKAGIPAPLSRKLRKRGTWVTVLTGDMGNTFLVLFSSVASLPRFCLAMSP